MNKYLLLLTSFLFISFPSVSQAVRIKINGPGQLKGRKAILLTREKGFASTVHSLKLTGDTISIQMANDLVPELYQLNVSQMKGSLLFFLEPGTQIRLDTTDISRSEVSNSKSNPDWKLFQDSIQRPYDRRFTGYSQGETRARKRGNSDSLSYWFDRKTIEYKELISSTRAFIIAHPRSFVSLYLLKSNWYAFKGERIFEKLDVSLAAHRSYQFLKRNNH